jgi:signal transduction histidine kinase
MRPDPAEPLLTSQQIREAEAQLIHTSRLSALGEMSTMIAHEINQPLMIISTLVDRLRRQHSEGSFTTEQLPEILEQADQALGRASDVIRHMRSYSYQDSEIPRNCWIEPIPAIQQALDFFHVLCKQEGIPLRLETPEPLNAPHYRIWAEPRQLEQLVVNLTHNAIHAIVDQRKKNPEQQYQVTVHCFIESSGSEPQFRLEVADNGIGMSDDQRLRCLDPFYTTRPVGEGSGLGLFIAKSIIKRFQADLTIHSKPRRGTQVVVGFRLSY